MLGELRQASLQQHTDSYKWLTASLLVINGAACLSILSLESLGLEARLAAGSLFSAGVVFALLTGVANQRANQSIMPEIRKQLGYWLAVAYHGVREPELEATHRSEFRSAKRLALLGSALGRVSGLCWILGAVTLGVGMFHAEKVPEANVEILIPR